MKLLAVVAAFALFVAACAAPQPHAPAPGCRMFVVSPDFPGAEFESLSSAVDRWNEIAIEPFCLRPAEKDEQAEQIKHGIFRIKYDSDYWRNLSKDFGGANVVGVHFGGSDQIGIVDILDARLFELTALHEFGHAHGLGHTEAPAIMHESVGTTDDFTPIDLTECRRVGACRKED